MPSRNYSWQYQFEAIGTHWVIDVGPITKSNSGPSTTKEKLEQKIVSRVSEFDQLYSRFRSDSLVAKMSQAAGRYPMPKDGMAMFNFYEKLYRATNGLVTPLIGQTMEQAGYDANYSLSPKPLTSPLPWDEVLQYNQNTITLLQPALLDFGAAGKGYLLDLVAEVLHTENIPFFCIDAGGDILEYSQNIEPLKVGLEDPEDITKIIGTVPLANQSLCASAGNRRKWANFNHIINPKTKTSPEQIIATWVIAKTGLQADGLATALFFSDPEYLQSQFQFEYLIIFKDRTIAQSNNFPAQLFLNS